MSVDLNFTKDPDWITARTNVWEPWAEELRTGLRKKELDQLRHYFFTGEVLPGADIGDSAKLLYFPLMNTEGWNYVFQHTARNTALTYRTEYYQSINDKFWCFEDLDASLRYFDYFHDDEEQSHLKGSPAMVPVNFVVDVEKKVRMLCANASKFLKSGMREIIFHRRNIIFKELANIKPELFQEGRDLYVLLSNIMRVMLEHDAGIITFDNALKVRLLADFRDVFDSLSDQALIKQRWIEIQNESKAV